MTKLDELIAKRNELDKEIERLREASEEYAPTVVDEKPLSKLTQQPTFPRYWLENDAPISISITNSINVDNSVRTSTTTNKHTDVDTTLTCGDSAIGMLGNLLGKLF